MRKILPTVLILVITFLFETPFAQGQPQWLQYRSAREADRLLGDISTQILPLSPTTKPNGILLPEFKDNEPLFACWTSTMTEKDGFRIALQRSRKNGLYDSMLIDTNDNHSLKDDTEITTYRQDSYQTYFGPVKVIFKGDDGPITYHLNFEFYDRDDKKELRVYSGGWYEGEINIAGQKKYCMLIDYNANGSFNDKSLDPRQCDRIRIGAKNNLEEKFVGKYLQVDQTLCQLEISPDGAYIKSAPAVDVTYGKIRLPELIIQFVVSGENGLFSFAPENAMVKLPVGQYRILSWAKEQKDDNGMLWRLEGTGTGVEGDFIVNPTSETSLVVGESIVAGLTVKKLNNSTYSFNQSLQGQLGETITISRNNILPPPPKVRIHNDDGSYDRTYTLEYG
ncbi:hypothetical protein ACFL02_06865 [Planctomycetota bacterium]